MELYLQRHGRAFEPDPVRFPDDDLRPLTADGEHRLEAVAQGMQHMKLDLELILTSPLVRAKQTAEIVAETLGLMDRVKICDALAGHHGPAEIVKAVLKQVGPAQRVLLVGHQPRLGQLISFLTTGQDNLPLDFKKGAVCKLLADPLQPGPCAHLEWFLAPGQLKRM